MTQIKSLSCDGAYSYNGSVNGYSEQAQTRKDKFLLDARALLKQTGRFVAQAGWSEYDIRVNPTGVACSGDVHAEFWKAEDPFTTVYCTIGSTAVSLGGRKDGIVIMARQEKRVARDSRNSKPSYRNIWMGINQWIDPGMNNRELATQLLKIAGVQEPEDRGMLPGCTYHSRMAGSLAIPSMIVRNEQEAEALKLALSKAQAASTADAQLPGPVQSPAKSQVPAGQLSLFEIINVPEVANV